MDIPAIIIQLDEQISRLKQAREVLGGPMQATTIPKEQLPKASAAPKQKRTLSPEARARIAEAQRKRWAANRPS